MLLNNISLISFQIIAQGGIRSKVWSHKLLSYFHSSPSSNAIYCETAMASLRNTEKQISIEAPWGKIAGLTWGDPLSPPVLMSAGRMHPSSVFRPLVLRLPTNFYYVAIEVPGNGLSDHLPRGVRFTIFDLVPTIWYTVGHFKWGKFMYIGHSLGCALGKYYNMAYPGHMTRVVEIDPIPAYYAVTRDTFIPWYNYFYGEFYAEKYKKHNSSPDTAPKYSYKQMKELLLAQDLPDDAVELVLERTTMPAGDGLYRFTYDQRIKHVTLMPFSSECLKQLFISIPTPTFSILASEVIADGHYNHCPWVQDESAWPLRNYKFKIVKGNHNIHLTNVEGMADDISKFLLDGLKAKL